MKKWVFLLLNCLIASSLLFSSGQQQDEGASEEEPVVLKLLVDKDTSIEGIKAVAEAYRQKTGIGTEIELRPGSAEGENLLKTRLATGEMADLVYFNSGSLLTALNPARNFVDLTDMPYMDNISPAYKQTVTVGDRVYGIPASSSACGGILYNKKVYAELGLEVPQTWNEFMENCRIVKDAGKTAVIGSYKDDWTAQLFLLSDFYYVQRQVPDFAERFTKNQAKYATEPAALRAFYKYKEVYDNDFMNKDFLATTYDEALRMLAMGEGVHYPMLTFAFAILTQNYPDQVDDIGFFAQPDNTPGLNGTTVWLPNSIYIYKESPLLEQALDWAEFYVSHEGISIYSKTNKADGPYVVKGVELPPDTPKGILDLMKYFEEDRTAPALEFITPVKAPNSPQICVEVGSGISDPLEAAQKYDRDTNKQAKQLNLPGW
ncbi:extracellular solute-binding protein [Marispirochaeta sp.]|uniref:ABC transporter substrate-binding protein n=1 Tax=Marispirochaeta sp. TaxID=2038653 RepID=UPI0029C7725C|nr:extracellular solute-binding protein [Marispirochaeta sp.]